MTTTSAPGGPPLKAGPLTGSPALDPSTFLRTSRKRPGEKVAFGFLAGSALLTVAVTVGIFLSLLLPAIDFFREVNILDFLVGDRWAPRFAEPSFGVLPLLTGTLWTTAIGLAIAVPLGLGAAVYLSEYAHSRVRKILKPVLELLAGIPSVVYGYFALYFVNPKILQGFFHLDTGTFSVLSAGVVLGIMIIPTIASLSEDALSAVPMAMRQGSLALGANRMRTTLRVVFPAAISGIMAAIVLGLSRAVGETMIVALAAGSQATVIKSPLDAGQTMTGFIAQTATGESTPGTLGFNTLFAVGLLLFIITLIVNLIAAWIVRRVREEY